MKIFSVRGKSIRRVKKILMLALILSSVLAATFVQAQDGHVSWVKAVTMGSLQNDIAVDSSGNVYVAGHFYKSIADFDPGPGTFSLTCNPPKLHNIFISKWDSSGNFVWAKAMCGGSNGEVDIAIDSSSNIYITGNFSYTIDCDPGPYSFNLTSKGTSDVFISKLDSNGSFVWAKAIGGKPTEYIYNGFSVTSNDISLDSSGNVYTTGQFRDTIDFDPGIEEYNLASQGGDDIFISKLDNDGNFVWAKAIGGDSTDSGRGISTDTSGNVYTTGHFVSIVDFDPGPDTSNLVPTPEGEYDIFISKLDSSGSFVWAKTMGGTLTDIGEAIYVDSSGNIYVTGSFIDIADFDPGQETFELNSASYGVSDVFISKLDSNGNFVWAKALSGALSNSGYGITTDMSGNVFTVGLFQGTVDFDPGQEAFNLVSKGENDIFISKLDSSGNFVWADAMGGRGNDDCYGVSVDTTGNIFATGEFAETAYFNSGSGTCSLGNTGGSGFFISKLSDTPTPAECYSFPWNIYLPVILNNELP